MARLGTAAQAGRGARAARPVASAAKPVSSSKRADRPAPPAALATRLPASHAASSQAALDELRASKVNRE